MTEEKNYERVHYKQLIESLRLIAMSESQSFINEYFENFVDIPFEVADTYLNAFTLLPQLIEKKYFSFEVIANLIRLENFINSSLNDPDFEKYSNEDFFQNRRWQMVIKLSKETLIMMNISIIKPELKPIFIKG